MAERPILMNGPMVRATLEGRKTQTRRVVTPQPPSIHFTVGHDAGIVIDRHGEQQPGKDFFGIVHNDGEWSRVCPYGKPGDRLWVRETWQGWRRTSYECDEWEPLTLDARGGLSWAEYVEERGKPSIEYRATSKSIGPWTPSIHMPRWASRITLEVTSVRVERVQSISDDDAQAEGATPFPYNPEGDCWEAGLQDHKYRTAFNYLWGTINGFNEGDAKRPGCSWDANPWVWVVGFKVVHRG